MPTPAFRRDSYGRPLPSLTEAHREVLLDRPSNIEQRKRLLALLEEQHHQLLRRDVSAEVTVTFKIVEGIIQADIYVGAVRHYRFQREE